MKAQTVPDSRGLVPAIHALLIAKAWMPATSAGMTAVFDATNAQTL